MEAKNKVMNKKVWLALLGVAFTGSFRAEAAPTPAKTASEIQQKVTVEQALEEKLGRSLKMYLASDDFMVSVRVALFSDKVNSERQQKKEFALPGVPIDAEPTKEKDKEISIFQRIGNVSATVLIDKRFSEAQAEDVKKITVELLGLDLNKGDSLSVDTLQFPKGPTTTLMGRLSQQVFQFTALLIAAIFLFGPLRAFLNKAASAAPAGKAEGGGEGMGQAGSMMGDSRMPAGMPANFAAVPVGVAPGGPSSAAEATNGSNGKPFSFINSERVWRLGFLLSEEHAGQIAIVLSYLTPELADQLLNHLTQDKRKKVLAHLTQKKLVPSEIVKHLNDKIKTHIDLVVGGAEKLSGILDLRTPEEQEEMLANVEAADPGLAEYLRSQIVTLDKILSLSKSELQKVLWEAYRQKVSLGIVLQLAPQETQQQVLTVLPESVRLLVYEEMQVAANVIKQNEERKKLIHLAKQMKQSGLVSL